MASPDNRDLSCFSTIEVQDHASLPGNTFSSSRVIAVCSKPSPFSQYRSVPAMSSPYLEALPIKSDALAGVFCGSTDRALLVVVQPDVCWVCLGESTSSEPLTCPCRCPRPVHAACLARWQLHSAGSRQGLFAICCSTRARLDAHSALPPCQHSGPHVGGELPTEADQQSLWKRE
jgi:hypothetical protein